MDLGMFRWRGGEPEDVLLAKAQESVTAPARQRCPQKLPSQPPHPASSEKGTAVSLS